MMKQDHVWRFRQAVLLLGFMGGFLVIRPVYGFFDLPSLAGAVDNPGLPAPQNAAAKPPQGPTLLDLYMDVMKADKNGNGLIDMEERFAATARRPEMFVQHLNAIAYLYCDRNKDMEIQPAERSLLGQGLAALVAARQKVTLDSADLDHDGHCSRWEQSRFCYQLRWEHPNRPNDSPETFFEPLVSIWQEIDTTASQVDKNGNGFMDPDEREEAMQISLPAFDYDGDGQLDLFEQWDRAAAAFFEDALWRLCPDVDKNNNGWLDPDEKKVALARVLPVYDIDKDGQFDEGERWMISRDGRYSGNPPQKGNVIAMDLPGFFAQRRQADDAVVAARIDKLMQWLQSQLERDMDPGLDKAGKQAVWEKLVAKHDRNHSGRLDQLEMYRLFCQELVREQQRTLPTWPLAWRAHATLLAGGLDDLMTPMRPVRAISFAEVDADHDGVFTRADRQAIRSRVREAVLARETAQAMLVIWPNEDQDHNGRLSEEETAAALRQALPRFDANRDGRLDEAESRALITAGYVAHRDALVAQWMERIGRGADLDGDGRLNAAEEKLARDVLMLNSDQNFNGKLDQGEIFGLQYYVKTQVDADRELAKDQADLPRFDLDGDGRLNEPERRRRDLDRQAQAKQGVVVPPQEE